MSDQDALQAGAECLEAALDYLSRGWAALAICPPDHASVGNTHAASCKSPGKAVLGPWKAYQDTLPTVADLQRKWRYCPTANVGIALGPLPGSGLVRVDVEGATGEAHLRELCGGDPPATLEFTSGKGRGLLYAIPPQAELRTTVKPFGIGDELRIQAKGAQTVMVPSRHPEGRRYRWKEGHGPTVIAAALMPEWMVLMMRPKPMPAPQPTPIFDRHAVNSGSVMTRVRAYLAKCPPAVQRANGSIQLMSTLRLVIDGFALDDDEARVIATEYSAKCVPPWSEQEVEHALGNIKGRPSERERGWLLAQQRHQGNGAMHHYRETTANMSYATDTHAETVNADDDGDAAEQVQQQPSTDPMESTSIQLTDVGNGQRFAQSHGWQSRHCHSWKKWLFWDGCRWRIDDTGRSKALAKQTICSLFAWAKKQIDLLAKNESDEAQRLLARIKFLLSWALKSQSAPRINALLDLARSEPNIPILPSELDRDPWLLNCTNGTLDLRTGQLRPHDRGDYLTKMAPVAFDPQATCPRFERFLMEIFDASDNLVAYLQRLVGYWLTGSTMDTILPVLYGVGANGKSVLINLLFALLGEDYSGKASRDLLIASKGNRHPTELAWLHGKRFVATIETSEGARLDEALVKDLTGGDKINARKMREDFWEFPPTHKIVLVTNHKPRIKGTDHAMWRRVRLIPFNVIFADDKQDKRLTETLQAELPGVLNWALHGCEIWQKHGLQDPPEVIEATKEYRSQEDVLSAFLAEKCLSGPDYRAPASVLYASYKEWCEAGSEKHLSSRMFIDALREKKYKDYKNNNLWFEGLALRIFDQAATG